MHSICPIAYFFRHLVVAGSSGGAYVTHRVEC